MFEKCTELFNKLELDIPEDCIGRAHRIGKKTPGRVRPIIVRFTTWRHRTMVYRKRKDCFNCRIILDLMAGLYDEIFLSQVVKFSFDSFLSTFNT